MECKRAGAVLVPDVSRQSLRFGVGLESVAFEHPEAGGDGRTYQNSAVISKVTSYPWKGVDGVNAMGLKGGGGADSREEQELRTVDGTCGKNHLLFSESCDNLVIKYSRSLDTELGIDEPVCPSPSSTPLAVLWSKRIL